MNLVVLNKQKDQAVVSSKDISTNFGKRHDHVLRDIDNLKDVPNFGEMFYETEIEDSYKRKQRAYLMNRDGFSLLVMGFTGKDALEWKVKYIQAFNQMETMLNSPEFIIKRAMGLLQQKCDSLMIENKEIKKQIEEQKPKVAFATAVEVSEDSILVRELAKLAKQNGVNVGQNRLWQMLREKGYIVKNGTEPTQKAMNLGLFEILIRTVQRGNSSKETRTTKVTGKGQIYFINKLLNEWA